MPAAVKIALRRAKFVPKLCLLHFWNIIAWMFCALHKNFWGFIWLVKMQPHVVQIYIYLRMCWRIFVRLFFAFNIPANFYDRWNVSMNLNGRSGNNPAVCLWVLWENHSIVNKENIIHLIILTILYIQACISIYSAVQ